MQSAQTFTELCQKIYLSAEEYSVAVWIIVHCGLFYLFWHCRKDMYSQLGMDSGVVEAYVKKCASNAEGAIHRLRLCMDPTVDNAEALILAVRLTVATSLLSRQLQLTLDRADHEFLLGFDVHGSIKTFYRMEASVCSCTDVS